MYVKRFKAGEVHLPRAGFTRGDQERTVSECSRIQLAIQGGACGLCGKPIKGKLCWIRCDKEKNLRKWAYEEDRHYDYETGCHIYTPRSPEAIRAEYRRMKNELVHFGCVIKYQNERWGHAGTTKTAFREYERVLIERGYAEDPPPPEAVPDLWRVARERLEARRIEHLRTIGKKGRASLRKRNPKWGTGSWKSKKRYVDAERKPDPQPNERDYATHPFTPAESAANLQAAYDEAMARDAIAAAAERELLDSLGVKRPGGLSDAPSP